MELDENFKRLIKELGDAINESLSDSDRIAEVMSRIRSAGYDLFLVLEVTIGFNKRGEVNLVHRHKLDADVHTGPEFHLTTQDTQFLRALKIVVDERPRLLGDISTTEPDSRKSYSNPFGPALLPIEKVVRHYAHHYIQRTGPSRAAHAQLRLPKEILMKPTRARVPILFAWAYIVSRNRLARPAVRDRRVER